MASRLNIQGEDALKKVLDYFSKEDSFEKEVYENLKKEILSLAREKELKNLSKLVFAMIKPAAFARGLAPEIIEWLHHKGFRIALAKLKDLRGKELDELYVFVKRKYHESWWIMERAYSMAPALAMVLVGDSNGFEHASARLRSLIGPTTPEAGKQGNLRYDLKGVNRVFNIIHISDDPAAALRESSVFFDKKEVLESLNSDNEAEIGMLELRPSNVIRLSRWDIFSRLKARCNSILGSNELQELLDIESKIVSKGLSFDEERSELFPIEIKISELAHSLKEKAKEEAIDKARSNLSLKDKKIWDTIDDKLLAAQCIELLSDELLLIEEQNFDLVLLWMIDRGVIVDEWEEIITHSTWAVMPQMIKDLKKYRKIVISRRG